jgi:hypothetical protein
VKQHNHVLDPPRYPKLITPIETSMKDSFTVVVKKLMIDVTKQLTQAIKYK